MISAVMAAWNQIVNSWLALFWPIGCFIIVSPSFSHLHFSFKDLLLTVADASPRLMVYSLLIRRFSMESISKIRKQSPGTNSLIEPDYSGFTLVELFRARYWIDIK